MSIQACVVERYLPVSINSSGQVTITIYYWILDSSATGQLPGQLTFSWTPGDSFVTDVTTAVINDAASRGFTIPRTSVVMPQLTRGA